MIIILMVITSPIVILVNPSLAKTASTPSTLPTISTIPSAPSTIGQDGSEGDFSTQAALSGVWARQTNNIVGSQSYYDIVFVTSTTGTIKFIDITFPAGTLIGDAPRLVEREGIGAGNAVKSSSTMIRYTVLSPVSIPADTKIRLEFFNIVNPTLPSTGYKVTVTTRTAGGTIIDGPTVSNSLNMKQIGTGQIADGAITSTKPAESFMKKVTLLDDATGNAKGWNPNGGFTEFTISEPAVASSDGSFISMSIIVPNTVGFDELCEVDLVEDNTFTFGCQNTPIEGSQLHYVVENLPPHVGG